MSRRGDATPPPHSSARAGGAMCLRYACAILAATNEEFPVSEIYKLPLVLEPQAEGGYVVTCPLLPELITEGETVQEALQNANDALAAIVEGLRALDRPLPEVLKPAQGNTPLWVETVLAV